MNGSEVMVLQAVAHQAQGETETALSLLGEALELAEPGGFIRLFVDEGAPMAELLSMAAAQGIMPAYADKLLSKPSRWGCRIDEPPAPSTEVRRLP
jgi:LuxR family transcriptional regulator, maltose regulon positive regulatory protein